MLVGAILYGIAGKGFAKVTREQRLEGNKEGRFSGISKCKDLEAGACLLYLKSREEASVSGAE